MLPLSYGTEAVKKQILKAVETCSVFIPTKGRELIETESVCWAQRGEEEGWCLLDKEERLESGEKTKGL